LRLEAMTFRILWAKNYEHPFKLLRVIEENPGGDKEIRRSTAESAAMLKYR